MFEPTPLGLEAITELLTFALSLVRNVRKVPNLSLPSTDALHDTHLEDFNASRTPLANLETGRVRVTYRCAPLAARMGPTARGGVAW